MQDPSGQSIWDGQHACTMTDPLGTSSLAAQQQSKQQLIPTAPMVPACPHPLLTARNTPSSAAAVPYMQRNLYVQH